MSLISHLFIIKIKFIFQEFEFGRSLKMRPPSSSKKKVYNKYLLMRVLTAFLRIEEKCSNHPLCPQFSSAYQSHTHDQYSSFGIMGEDLDHALLLYPLDGHRPHHTQTVLEPLCHHHLALTLHYRQRSGLWKPW